MWDLWGGGLSLWLLAHVVAGHGPCLLWLMNCESSSGLYAVAFVGHGVCGLRFACYGCCWGSLSSVFRQVLYSEAPGVCAINVKLISKLGTVYLSFVLKLKLCSTVALSF